MINPEASNQDSRPIIDHDSLSVDLFSAVSASELPDIVSDEMIKQASLYMKPDLMPNDLSEFRNFLTLQHDNGDTSYLATQDKHYHDGVIEESTHLVGLTLDDEINGLSEIRFNRQTEDDYFYDKPFVGWTKTIKGYEHQGLGRRRLLTMNLASLAIYGLPLHSDTIRCQAAVDAMWNRLINEGRAEQYDQAIGQSGEATYPRYRFL